MWESCQNVNLLLILLFFFATLFLFSIRKELRINKVVNQETTVQLGHSIEYNRVDPSRVIQLSWQPRSGTLVSYLFCYLHHVPHGIRVKFSIFFISE